MDLAKLHGKITRWQMEHYHPALIVELIKAYCDQGDLSVDEEDMIVELFVIKPLVTRGNGLK